MNALISKCAFYDKSRLAAAFVAHLLLFLTQRASELAVIQCVAADSEGRCRTLTRVSGASVRQCQNRTNDVFKGLVEVQTR